MAENPHYDDQPIRNTEEETIVVVNPDGTEELIGLTQHTVILDNDGNRTFQKRRSVIVSTDGRMITNPEQEMLYRCPCCPLNYLYTRRSIRFCQEDQQAFCLEHIEILRNQNGTIFLCSYHARRERWIRRLDYFLSAYR